LIFQKKISARKSRNLKSRVVYFSSREQTLMIYADNAATTKISNKAYEKMLPFLQEQYGNPGSQYSLGIIAKRAIEHARKQVASAIGANYNEIIFTSGGSETNSWVLHGVVDSYKN
jgi:cysteine desulfurase